MARLKGRTWGGMPAADFVLSRLDGEDGEQPWSLRHAAKEVSRRLKIPITEVMLSRWRKETLRARDSEADMAAMIEGSIRALAQQAESGVSLEELVDAQIVQTIAKVYADDGVEAALDTIKAFAGLKRSITADRDSRQGIREYEESVGNLKEIINQLRTELKRQGGDPDKVNTLNTKAVAAIDAVILAGKRK